MQSIISSSELLGSDLNEIARLKQMTLHEEDLYKQGFQNIAGIDEAGRGPLAGPVVAAACVISKGFFLPGINDSKKLSAKQRHALYTHIISSRKISYALGVVEWGVIDEINILRATFNAMNEAVHKLSIRPDYILVDGSMMPSWDFPSHAIVKGDSLSQTIAAASVVAKVARDQIMDAFHLQWPEYGFNQHKGYGTRSHLQAIHLHGPCPIHRKSFEPIKSLLG